MIETLLLEDVSALGSVNLQKSHEFDSKRQELSIKRQELKHQMSGAHLQTSGARFVGKG